MAAATVRPVRYYDLKKNWRKVKQHIDDPEVQKVLVRDFNRFTWGSWRLKFLHGMVPTDFETCDWQFEHRGRRPAFWRYTKHAACHWLANFALMLAQRVEPNRPWRIITSDQHSSVWDGDGLLFEFNFQALGISAEECFELACEYELPPGQQMKTYPAKHYSHFVKKMQAAMLEDAA